MTTYFDSFDRPNTGDGSGLGAIPNGPNWVQISGLWNINNNQANTSTNRAQNPITVVNAVSPNASTQIDISAAGGDAVYARVVDSTNWWRVRMRRWQTTAPVYTTEYQWQATYGGTGTAVGNYNWNHNHGTSITSTTWSTSNTACPHGNSHSHSHIVPATSNVTNTWNANHSRSWRSVYNSWRTDNNNVYQGQFENFGRHKGLWFFPDSSIRSTLANKTITNVRLRATRSSGGGNFAQETPTIRLHNYSNQPSGEPNFGSSTSSHGQTWNRGDTKWVTLANSWGNQLRDGNARGIGLFTTSNIPYMIFTPSATLEITSYYQQSTSNVHSHGRTACVLTGSTRQVQTGTSTTTHHAIYLERSLNGTVFIHGSSSGSTNRLRLDCDGNQIRAYKGTSSSPWITVTNSTHNNSGLFGIGRGPSELNGHMLDNFRLQIFTEPPFAPALNSPVGNQNVDSSIATRFNWTFSSPNSGDSQSKFQLDYGIIGQTTTTITRETQSTEWWVSSGTLVPGEDYRWRVKVWNATNQESVFSDWEYFSAIPPPDSPNISSPTQDQTIMVTETPLTWSAAEQEAWQARIYTDLNGSANLSELLWDSGTVNESGTRSTTIELTDNNTVRHIQLRVFRLGLWSAWATRRVNVQFERPPVPTLFLTPRMNTGGIEVVVDNPVPGGAQPSVEYNNLQRRTTQTNWAHVSEVSRNGIYVDFSTESATEYEYRVVAIGDNGTSIASPAYTGMVTYNKWFLKDPDNITSVADHIQLFVDGNAGLTITSHEDNAEFSPLGRAHKLIVRDVIRGDNFNITAQVLGIENRRHLINMRKRQKTLLLQSPIQQWYISIGKDLSRNIINTVEDYEMFSFECIEQEDPFDV